MAEFHGVDGHHHGHGRVDSACAFRFVEPDVFLAAAERLCVPIERVYVVGDSTWDLLGAWRCHALGLGLKSGGVGEEELQRAGALRVYEDPADLLDHLDELATHPE